MTLPLFRYQDEAADIMAPRDRFGLHDEMGIGKTATSIGTINRITRTGRGRGMIVAPAMLRENWIKEFHKFSTIAYKICKGQSIHDFIAWSRGRFDILITSYDLATKWRKEFAKQGEFIDYLVFDEGHFLKNYAAQRTQEMLGVEANGQECLVEWAAQAYHVTGTMMPNDPMDSYTFLRFAGYLQTMAPREFMRTFFVTKMSTYGYKTTVKPEMLSTLQAMIAQCSIKRTHAEVGMYLPQIWMREVLVDGDKKEITDLIKNHPGLEQAIIDAIEQGGLSFLDVEYIAMLRRLVGKAKVIPYAQMLKWELDSGAGKRVIFCLHTEPLLYLRNFLTKFGYECVIAYGETPEHERQEAVRRFMDDPNVKVFIGNIKVAGVGLTLTESSDIDILESDWTPAGNAQAIKRVHRYGQTKAVTARFITLAGSVDEAVNKVVAAKTAAIADVEGSRMNAAIAS